MGNTDQFSILIIEDHKIVALGIKTIVLESQLFSVVECANTARQAIELTVAHKESPYTVFIVDVELPDMAGIELVKTLKTCSPDSAIIFHTIHDEVWNLHQMIKSGANAIVMKSDDPAELKIALGRVLDGKSYFSAHFSEACEEMDSHQTLSEREIEVLKLIADGISTKDIADRLFVSPNTIEFHRKRIMRKLGVSNMAQLVKEGFAKGYINKYN